MSKRVECERGTIEGYRGRAGGENTVDQRVEGEQDVIEVGVREKQE